MDCTFKITKSNIVSGLKLASTKYGVPINAYLSFISNSTDEDANLTDEFKQKLSVKFNTPVEELDSTKLDDVIKFITDEYNKAYFNVNYSADNETSYPEIAEYGYTSVYARDFSKRIALQFVLSGKREIEEKHGSIDNYIENIRKATGKKLTKLEAYTRILKGKITNSLKNRAIQRGVATIEEISELIANRDIAKIEELFGKKNVEDINLLAVYKELIEGDTEFINEALRNDGNLRKSIYERKGEKEILDYDDTESQEEDENSSKAAKEDDAVDNYISNLTNNLGDVGHYMSNIDNDIRLYFSAIPKLISTEKVGENKDKYQYDTNNPLGIPDVMDATQCINTILGYANAYNVTQLKEEIRRIAQHIPGMEGLIQVADYMDTNKSFAYKLWCNFSKTIIAKTETSNVSGGFQARQSNINSNRESVLKFDFINSFKQSSITIDENRVNNLVSSIDQIKKTIVTKQRDLSFARKQADKDKLNKEIDELFNKLISTASKGLKYYFNTIQAPAIELFIKNSEDRIAAIDSIVNTFNTLAKHAAKAKNNYKEINRKLDELYKKRKELNERISSNSENLMFLANNPEPGVNKYDIIKDTNEAKKELELINGQIDSLYKTDYIDKDFMKDIAVFTKNIARYSLVKLDLNSRTVNGNLSSDLINNSMITNILKTLQNPKSLANFGKYREQSRQYDFSNIMVEHRDAKGNIINYGLFTQNPDTKELTPTPYASRLLKESLYAGIADVDTHIGTEYAKMSKPDYVVTSIINYFKNERNYDEEIVEDGGPTSFANYFLRTPSDAPKNFIIRAPKYSIKETASSDGLFKADGSINKEHPIFVQFRQAFVQEAQDAANAIHFIFHNPDCEGSIDPTIENEETGKEPTRLRPLMKNKHYKDGNLFVKDEKTGKFKRDKRGNLILSGNIFHSDRFVVTHYDEITNKVEEVNYGELIFDEAFNFFYGGAESIRSKAVTKGVEIVLSDKQNEIIDKYIAEFIKDYSEQCYKKALKYKHLIGEATFSEDDIKEHALNYHLMYINCNDILEGDTKTYKNSQDTLKRFKEGQGSGVSYGLLDYEDDLLADRTPVESSPLNDTTFIKKTIAEDGTVKEEPVKIIQYNRWKGVTVKNTIRTGDTIGTFKLGKKGKPAKFIKDENGELIESDKGNYIFDKPGTLSKRFIEALKKTGLSDKNANIHAANIMAGYYGTTINDAQSYITFEEWVRRITARGQLEEYKPIIDAIYDETKPLDAKTIGKFIQVQKNFYFDQHYYAHLGSVEPRQIKNAEFVLVPRLIKGTQLEEVYNMMKDADIDQLNTEETSKAGKCNILTIWDNDGNITDEAKRDFVTNAAGAAELYNYNYLYTQQETPSHLDSVNKAGIQFMKKIIDNIDEFLPNGEKHPLWDAKVKFQQNYVDNIISSAEEFADTLGIHIDEDGNVILDKNSPLDTTVIYELLRDEIARQGLDSNSMDYVTLDDHNIPLMPAYAGLFNRKLESIVQGLINNRITRQTLPGFHAAQITNVGFRPFSDTVKNRSYSTDLKYHPDEYVIKNKKGEIIERISEREWLKKSPEEQNKYTNNGASSYIEIMLPKSNFKFNRKTKDGRIKSDDELLEELRNSGADTIIGYRIPTEGKQSICIMKVVGFTDDAYDSTIVVPDDWVSQTGSDFDIDSVYGIHFTTELDKNGKLILAQPKEVTHKDYIKYIKKKLKRVLDNKGIATSIKDDLQKEVDKYVNENSEKYEELTADTNEIYFTMKYKLQNIVKQYNKVEAKGKTKREQYINKLVYVVKHLNDEIKNNKDLSKKEQRALNLYNTKLKELYSFLSSQDKDFLDNIEQNKERLNEELVNKLSQLALKADLPSYEKFKERRTSFINKNIRNNEILKCAIEILGSDFSLEENLSRSNFEKLIEARDDIQPEHVKQLRKARSPYNFYDQADYQEDAMSGAKLKGASVVRDTFVSICNTAKTRISDDYAIKVIYSEKDGYTLDNLRQIFPKVIDNKNGTFTVYHNTLGWTKNNKNIADLLVTPYTSQTTAHILDAIKEGAIPNVNDYTFNVYKTFSDVGCDFYMSVAFMMQPAVTRIVAYNNNKNSIYADASNINPIKSTIIDIANKLNPKGEYTVYTSTKKIINEISEQYKEVIDLHFPNGLEGPLSFNELNERLLSNDDSIYNDLLDLKVAITFSNIRALATEIGNNARLLNPDKFGAKQSVFETIQTIDKIKDAKLKQNPILYVETKDKSIKSLINAVYTTDLNDSVYKPLNAFYKYSTKFSVDLSKLLFPQLHSERFDELLKSIDRFLPKELDEDTYNSFRSYVLNYCYTTSSAIKNRPVIDENGNLSFDPDTNRREELTRIYGTNKSVDLFVKDSTGNTIRFDIVDINHPTVEEIRQFSTLSPAQKVYFIKNKAVNKGIFDYIEESLSNRGKLGDKQTLRFLENSVDIETVYSEFEKAYFNSNPLIKLAAIDLVKYAYVVDGSRMKRGSIAKIIKNNVLYTSQEKGGLGIIEESNKKLEDIVQFDDVDLQNELRFNFIRSHPELITAEKIKYHETAEWADKNKTKHKLAKDITPTAQGIIIITDENIALKHKIIYTDKFDNVHVKPIVKLVDNGIATLYKVHDLNDRYVLTPLNTLEENEFIEMSINPENNKHQRDAWYTAVVENYIDKLNAQYEELKALKNKPNKEEKAKIENNPKYSINSSISELLAQADLAQYITKTINKSKYARKFDINDKNSPYTSDFERIIDKIKTRFEVEKGKLLILRSPSLPKFIFAEGTLYGSTQTIDGVDYNIQRVFYGLKNKKYIEEKQKVIEANEDVNEIFTEAQANDELVRDTFAITPSNNIYNSSTDELTIETVKEQSEDNVYYSSTDELNAVPTTKIFNHKTIETMYFRRRSFNDPRAISSIDFIDSKNLNSNPNYIEDNKKLITQINADYIVGSINDILTKLDNFKIGDKVYKIDSDEVIEAIRTDEALKQEFLKIILDARAFSNTFSIIDQIDITAEDPDVAKLLTDIKNAVGKLRASTVIANCEIKFGNEVLAKLSDNPLIQKKILGVFDGYHTASLFDAWINDLQETSNPLLQIVSSQVMKDLRKKEMLAKQEVVEFKKTIADIQKRAAAAGVTINWDNIIDDEGKFIQAYNQAFLDKLRELRDKKNKAKCEIDTNPKAYYEAKLEFDKWKAENLNQEAKPGYYKSIVQLDEYMLNNHHQIFIKYKTLQARQSELLSYINGGTLNSQYAEELDKINKEIDSLTSDFIEGDQPIPKYSIDDPNNPLTGETRIIYSIEAAYALRDYKKNKAELDKEYFEYKAKFNFEQELERNLGIISRREIRDANGKLLTPTSELMQDPEYVAAKEWISNNTYFSYSSEVRNKLNDAFAKLRESQSLERQQYSKIVSLVGKRRNAYDQFGIINAQLLTDEDIDTIKRAQQAEYQINETNPFSDRTLITNAPDDDVVFSTAFYNQMRSDGVSNPEYIDTVNKINNILRDHYDPSTREVNTSELTISELDELQNLYQKLNDIKKTQEGTATNGKSIFEFIRDNVDFIYNEEKYNEEQSKALAVRDSIGGEEGRRYYAKWLLVNNELVKDESGTDRLVPNHFLYGYAVPRGYVKGQENPYIDKDKTEALRYIKENSSFVPTAYYHKKYAEMKSKSDDEFKAWFDANHIYNPYTHRIEPLKCWTTIQVKDDNKKEQYLPKFNYKNRVAKKDKKNINYKPDGGYAQNYNGKNTNYNTTIRQNIFEKELSDLCKEKVNKYAVTQQAKSFAKQGYAPIRQKDEELSAKKIEKELLKLIGFINTSTGKEEWLDDEQVDYAKDSTLDMPMTTMLKSKETVDIKYTAPKRKPNQSIEDYNKEYDEWYTKKQESIKANREIHKKLLDKNWPSVFEEFIIRGANFNAIQDNKYMLFYAKNMIDSQRVYIKNLGFNKLQKTGGRTIDGKVEYASRVDDNQRGQFINWVRRIVYDQYKKPNNKLTKFANTMQSITSAKYMMFNYLGGVANITQGWNQILGERFAEEYFGSKNWYRGITDWNTNIGSFIYDMYKDKATSLESAIVQFFNVVDFTELMGIVDIPDMATYISRLRDFAFSPQAIGEHFMQNSALFAMLHSHRLYYEPDDKKDGRLVYKYKTLGQVKNEAYDKAFREFVKGTKFESLYNEFIKYETSKPDYKKDYVWFRKDFTTEFMNIYMRDKLKEFTKIKKETERKAEQEFNDNTKHPTIKSQLALSEDGHLKIKDDSDLLKRMTNDEAMELLAGFKGRVISVNKKIHGIYDKLGAARFENKWGGALIMQYHKHFYPGIMKRWRRQGYFNEERGTIEKGTNMALLDFIALPFHNIQFVKKLKADNNMTDSQLQCVEGFQNICKAYLDFFTHFTLYYKMLPKHEQANILRGFADFASVAAAISGAIGIQILGAGDDDKGFGYNFFINQADRLASESMSFRSFGIIGEGKKLWSSPVAAQSWIEDVGQALSLCAQYWMEGDDFDPTYTSGMYKGENKFMMLLKRNTPMWHSIYMIERLDKNNKNYKLDENMLSIIPTKKIAEYITD